MTARSRAIKNALEMIHFIFSFLFLQHSKRESCYFIGLQRQSRRYTVMQIDPKILNFEMPRIRVLEFRAILSPKSSFYVKFWTKFLVLHHCAKLGLFSLKPQPPLALLCRRLLLVSVRKTTLVDFRKSW